MRLVGDVSQHGAGIYRALVAHDTSVSPLLLMEFKMNIAQMVDPMGKYWDQPNREDILVDDVHAIMARTTFEKLKCYDTTLPTGVYVGKMWRRHYEGDDYLVWYDVSKDPDKCSIQQRKILLT
jgi:hypothetical protein